jgi:hypothetical protein
MGAASLWRGLAITALRCNANKAENLKKQITASTMNFKAAVRLE